MSEEKEFKLAPLIEKIYEISPEPITAIHVHPLYYEWLLQGPCQRYAMVCGIGLLPGAGLSENQATFDISENIFGAARSWTTELDFS